MAMQVFIKCYQLRLEVNTVFRFRDLCSMKFIHSRIVSYTTCLPSTVALLLQGKEIQAIIDTDIIYPEIADDPDTICSFLLVTGYLRITGVISEFHDNPICSLEIPHKEIKSVFQKEILDQYTTLFTGALLRDFEMAVRTADADLFADTLQKYLQQSAGSLDTSHENFYHGTVFGMLAILSVSIILRFLILWNFQRALSVDYHSQCSFYRR